MNVDEKSKVLKIYTVLTIIAVAYVAIRLPMYLSAHNNLRVLDVVDFATSKILGPLLVIIGYFIIRKRYK